MFKYFTLIKADRRITPYYRRSHKLFTNYPEKYIWKSLLNSVSVYIYTIIVYYIITLVKIKHISVRSYNTREDEIYVE